MCYDNSCKNLLDELILFLFVLLIFCTFFYISSSNTGKEFIGSFNIMFFFLFATLSSIRMCDYGPFSWMRKIKKCCKGELVTEEDNSEV